MNLTDVRSRLHLNTPKSQLFKIELSVFITFLLLLILLPSRFLRRKMNFWLLKYLDLGANIAIFLFIPFIYGLMINSDFKHQLIPVWATFLLYVYSAVPDALSFSQGLSLGVAYAKFLLYFFYVMFMLYRVKSSSFGKPLQLLFYTSMVKILEKVSAPMMDPSRSTSVEEKVISRYISKALLKRPNDDSHDREDVSGNRLSSASDDNDTLLQCKYVVDPRGRKFQDGEIVDPDPAITVGQIWQCQETSLLSSTNTSSIELKSTCLSFALLLMFVNRSVPSHERPRQEEAWKFVRYGLVGLKSPLNIIEVELAFFGDLFFKKYCPLYYLIGLWYIPLQKMLFLGSIAWMIVILSKSYRPMDQSFTIQFHGQDIDLIVTSIAIISTTLLELSQLISFSNSRWAKVRLICIYLRRKSWKKNRIRDWLVEVAAQLLCPVRYHLNKPLQRRLGQFSLLPSCMYKQWGLGSCFLHCFRACTATNYGRPGRKQSKAKILSNEIEKAVIQSLKDRGPRFTNGIGSLEASDLPKETEMKLTLAHKQTLMIKMDTHAHVVLMWHIATYVCENNPGALGSTVGECSDFRVATTLSKYCAYLVAFNPDLLPGQAHVTDSTCSYVIQDALKQLQTCEYDSYYGMLMQIAHRDRGEDLADQHSTIVQQGAYLGQVLNRDIQDPLKRWKVLADFWAEMILYLAPNTNNQWAHAERLADGGEFITVLWVLLFHAGIVDRDSFPEEPSDATVTGEP